MSLKPNHLCRIYSNEAYPNPWKNEGCTVDCQNLFQFFTSVPTEEPEKPTTPSPPVVTYKKKYTLLQDTGRSFEENIEVLQ
jgi:hypothetical protein